MKKILGMLLTGLASVTVAVTPLSAMAAPPPPPPPGAYVDAPPPPPPVQSGEALEPGVTIIETDKERIYEYRVNGQIYMVRVVPNAGPPYYYYDVDGDGELEYQSSDPRNSNINQWVLFRW